MHLTPYIPEAFISKMCARTFTTSYPAGTVTSLGTATLPSTEHAHVTETSVHYTCTSPLLLLAIRSRDRLSACSLRLCIPAGTPKNTRYRRSPCQRPRYLVRYVVKCPSVI